MRSLLFQDLITIRGSGTTPVVQSLDDWFDASPYADVVLWIQVVEVTPPGAGNVSLIFETAPAEEEALFTAIDTTTLSAGSASQTVFLRRIFLNSTQFSPTAIPLARFLRWKLVGSTAGTWDVTFRVYATFGDGIRGAFLPLALNKVVLWLRADLGVLTSGSSVTDWLDQSGNGNHVLQTVGGNQPVLVSNAIGGRPAIDFSGAKFLESNTATNMGIGANSAYSVLIVGKNGSGSFFTLRRSVQYSTASFFLTTTFVHSDGSDPNHNVTVANTTAETQSAINAFKSCHRFNGNSSVPDIYLNGTYRTPTSVGKTQTTENGTDGFVIGTNAVAQAWNGLIAEVIVTANAITDADRVDVETYQKAFFGV